MQGILGFEFDEVEKAFSIYEILQAFGCLIF